MANIKRRLLLSFIVLIASLLISTIIFIVLHYNIETQYKKTIESMILEYRITETVDNLVSLYLSLLQNIENKQLLSEYTAKGKEIDGIFFQLDKIITFEKSRIFYERVQNTIGFLKEYCEKGIESTRKRDFSQSSEILEQINRGKEKIMEDTTDLILTELSFSKEQQQELQSLENLSWIFSLTLIVLITLGCIILAFVFSNEISNPLVNLSKLAKDISKGNLKINVQEELLNRKDEIGSLSNSFDVMVKKLREKVETIQKEKEKVDIKVKERTKQLSEEHGKLSSLVKSVNLGVIMVDLSLNVVLANPAAKNILGKPLSEVLTFKDLNEKIKDIKISQALSYYIQVSKPLNIQEVMIGDRYFRLFMSPVWNITEKIFIGAVVIMEDITEQKKLEEAKSSFVAITAHELRTPLSVIRGNAELLLELVPKKFSEAQLKMMIDAIQRSSVRLLGIVDDFLDLTALEESRMRFKNEQFNLTDLVHEVVTDFQGKATEKSLFLKISSPHKPLPEILADRERTKEIIINILMNAIQYTEKGGITLSFEEKNEFVELSVKDTGIGIKPADQKSLFQKFQTVRGRFMHSKEYGSGMGLYISRLLAESMGGTVSLKESKPGVGSIFVIALPKANK